MCINCSIPRKVSNIFINIFELPKDILICERHLQTMCDLPLSRYRKKRMKTILKKYYKQRNTTFDAVVNSIIKNKVESDKRATGLMKYVVFYPISTYGRILCGCSDFYKIKKINYTNCTQYDIINKQKYKYKSLNLICGKYIKSDINNSLTNSEWIHKMHE